MSRELLAASFRSGELEKLYSRIPFRDRAGRAFNGDRSDPEGGIEEFQKVLDGLVDWAVDLAEGARRDTDDHARARDFLQQMREAEEAARVLARKRVILEDPTEDYELIVPFLRDGEDEIDDARAGLCEIVSKAEDLLAALTAFTASRTVGKGSGAGQYPRRNHFFNVFADAWAEWTGTPYQEAKNSRPFVDLLVEVWTAYGLDDGAEPRDFFGDMIKNRKKAEKRSVKGNRA